MSYLHGFTPVGYLNDINEFVKLPTNISNDVLNSQLIYAKNSGFTIVYRSNAPIGCKALEVKTMVGTNFSCPIGCLSLHGCKART